MTSDKARGRNLLFKFTKHDRTSAAVFHNLLRNYGIIHLTTNHIVNGFANSRNAIEGITMRKVIDHFYRWKRDSLSSYKKSLQPCQNLNIRRITV